jgi:hypothetical protein
MKTLKLSLFALLVPLLALAQATVVTKEAEGQAAIVNKDELKAFEDAKAAALRAAVESAAGVRIDADTVVVNNQLVRDQIFQNTSGYVKAFDVLEKKSEKGVFTVKVKAQVITENLDKDITAARDLVKRMGKPTLVIVIQEQTLPLDAKAMINSESISIVLGDVLRADGWEIKDEKVLGSKKFSLEGAATLGGTELKVISDVTKANYVLYGKAAFRHQSPSGGLISGTDQKGNQAFFPITGEYDLALAATESADQLLKLNGKLNLSPNTKERVDYSLSYERTTFDLIKAKKEEITGPVRKAIIEQFRDQMVNGRRLVVSVKGLESFGAAKEMKKAIEALKGIKEATQDGFADGKADFRVTYYGSADEFATLVDGQSFKKKKLAIVSQTGNTLEVQVAK